MTTLTKMFLVAILALALGLLATNLLVADGGPLDKTKLGPWIATPRAGALDADPYARASLERGGEIPLAVGEGLRLIAHDDDEGRRLDPTCVYRVGPRAPVARYWSLELTDLEGLPVANAAERYVLRSSEILRDEHGDFSIFVSGAAHSGNWLPIGSKAPFMLVLRLYDTPLSAIAGGVEKATTPRIARERCA